MIAFRLSPLAGVRIILALRGLINKCFPKPVMPLSLEVCAHKVHEGAVAK